MHQADEEVPWTYLWIGFGGKKAEDYLRDLGLNGLWACYNDLDWDNELTKDL